MGGRAALVRIRGRQRGATPRPPSALPSLSGNYDTTAHTSHASPLRGRTRKKIPCQNRFPTLTRYPLASASIIQVHAATLPTGEDVLIKAQRPDIDAALKADLSFVYVATRVVKFLQPD